MRETTVCFSGHRPEKLPDKGNANSQVIKTIKSLLHQEILSAVNDGYTRFITGMSRGVDLWAGEMVTELICGGENLRLTAVYPYRGFDSRYHGADKWSAGRILSKATEIIYLNEQYYRGCMSERNQYMTDNSSRLIAVVSNYRSGTGQTIKYAEKSGLELRIIDVNRIAPADDIQMSLFN